MSREEAEKEIVRILKAFQGPASESDRDRNYVVRDIVGNVLVELNLNGNGGCELCKS